MGGVTLNLIHWIPFFLFNFFFHLILFLLILKVCVACYAVFWGMVVPNTMKICGMIICNKLQCTIFCKERKYTLIQEILVVVVRLQ
jgi:hypothetical protein